MTVVHAWQGAVTPTGFRVVSKVTGSSTRLAVSTDDTFAAPTYTAAATPTADGVVSFTVSGLSAATPYWWAVEDDSTLDTDHRGTLTTFPTAGAPASFTFAAASCAGGLGATPSEHPGPTANTSNSPIFDTIRGTSPLFFAHTGDMHYRDIATADVAQFRTAYDDVLACTRQEHLYRTVPLVYTWDDHDYGPDDGDRTAAGHDEACQTYRERVPHYALPHASAIYQSFEVGRVLVIVTDARSERDPNVTEDSPAKTMLGTAQKTWLEGLLSTSTAQALVWINSNVWVAQGTQDSWGRFAHERLELVDLFNEYGWLGRMCIVAGDQHGLSIAEPDDNPWGGFPVFQFAALDQNGSQKGGPYTVGASTGGNRWGTIEVDDDGTTVTITGTGYIESTVWNSHSFVAVAGTVPDPVTPPPLPPPGVRKMYVG